MPRFAYVYILQSESNPEHFYTGRTDDLRDRLIRHNDGKVPHTAKWRPWRIKLISRFQTLNAQLSWNVILSRRLVVPFSRKRL
jgi:putative endonuclease